MSEVKWIGSNEGWANNHYTLAKRWQKNCIYVHVCGGLAHSRLPIDLLQQQGAGPLLEGPHHWLHHQFVAIGRGRICK